MKTTVTSLIAFTALVGASVATAQSTEPQVMYKICHVNSANGVAEDPFFTITFGRVIEIAEDDVPAHEAHGDSLDLFEFPKEFRPFYEDAFGIRLPNANCFFITYP